MNAVKDITGVVAGAYVGALLSIAMAEFWPLSVGLVCGVLVQIGATFVRD